MRVSLIIFFLSIIFSSCSKNNDNNFINARDSFVNVIIEEKVTICDEGACYQRTFKASSSGVVVMFKNNKVVLTAGHSCTPKDPKEMQKHVDGDIKIEVAMYGYDIHKMKHLFEVEKIDIGEDICVLSANTLWQDAVPVATKIPKYNEKLYNFAAPHGIFTNHMVPLLTGYYVGQRSEMAAFTIPAAAGSSGSMILNKKGQLVGMIHSVHSEFNHFALSPTLVSLKYFLEISNKERVDYFIQNIESSSILP